MKPAQASSAFALHHAGRPKVRMASRARDVINLPRCLPTSAQHAPHRPALPRRGVPFDPPRRRRALRRRRPAPGRTISPSGSRRSSPSRSGGRSPDGGAALRRTVSENADAFGRDLAPVVHVPEHLHDELTEDCRDMIHVETAGRDREPPQGVPPRTAPGARNQQRERPPERGIPTAHQDPDRPAWRRDRAHVALDCPRLKPDHHAQSR